MSGDHPKEGREGGKSFFVAMQVNSFNIFLLSKIPFTYTIFSHSSIETCKNPLINYYYFLCQESRA
jgi:hypothetical protein